MSAAREEAARAEERFEGAKRRLADIAHEIREMLEVEPAAVAELAEHRSRARRCPTSPRSRASSNACAASASGSAPSTCAPRRSCARSRRSTTTLTTERDDLVEAIKRLRQGIQSLNREARERLLASFEVVNGHFQRLFTQLFGGGTAELQLIESDDPLEAGLEILAQAARQEARDAVAALGRRAGADRAGADLRGVPHQSGADLRARRGRRAARRSQCRALLRPARRDDAARPTRASSSSRTTRSPWRA